MPLRRDRLKAMRHLRHLSQEKLAQQTGMSKRQISRYENGPDEPTADALGRIAKELQVSSDYLLDLVADPGGYMPDVPPDILRLARAFAALPQPLKDAIKAIIRSQPRNSNSH
jgi:transcriptional regulator with XRE-family HTH domain